MDWEHSSLADHLPDMHKIQHQREIITSWVLKLTEVSNNLPLCQRGTFLCLLCFLIHVCPFTPHPEHIYFGRIKLSI